MKSLAATVVIALAALFNFTASAAERQVVLKVPGMNCAACPYIVSKALKQVGGVKSVKTSLAKRTAVVVYDDAKANLAQLTQATKSAGYTSSPLK